MADSNDRPNKDTKTREVPEQKLDNGYSRPSDSRTRPDPKTNAPGQDFSHLEDATGQHDDQPIDNTPAGKAMGHSNGQPMTQKEDTPPARAPM